MRRTSAASAGDPAFAARGFSRKDTREYSIEERRECWVLSCKIGGLSVEYKVPKDICADEEELRAYVQAEELF